MYKRERGYVQVGEDMTNSNVFLNEEEVLKTDEEKLSRAFL